MEIIDTNSFFSKEKNKIIIKDKIKEQIKKEFANALFKLLLEQEKISLEEYNKLIK
jgi:hypothetical protein